MADSQPYRFSLNKRPPSNFFAAAAAGNKGNVNSGNTTNHLWDELHMSGTSKKSQGGTQRKLRCMGETNDQIEVKVLTTNDLNDENGENGENELE